MKTALCGRYAPTLLLFATLTALGQFLANAVREASAAKAIMYSLRSYFLKSKSGITSLVDTR